MGMIDCRISHEGARVGLAPAEIDSTPEASANGSIASDQLDLHGQLVRRPRVGWSAVAPMVPCRG